MQGAVYMSTIRLGCDVSTVCEKYGFEVWKGGMEDR